MPMIAGRLVPCWAVAVIAALLGAIATGAALTLAHGAPG